MSFYESIEEYSLFFGGVVLFLGVILVIVKIISLNNDKIHEKLKKTEFNDVSFWIITASLISMGLKLIFTKNI